MTKHEIGIGTLVARWGPDGKGMTFGQIVAIDEGGPNAKGGPVPVWRWQVFEHPTGTLARWHVSTILLTFPDWTALERAEAAVAMLARVRDAIDGELPAFIPLSGDLERILNEQLLALATGVFKP